MGEPSFRDRAERVRWGRFHRRWLALHAELAEHLLAGGTGSPAGWSTTARRLHELGPVRYMAELDHARQQTKIDQGKNDQRHHKLAAVKKTDPEQYERIRAHFPAQVDQYERCWCVNLL